MSKLYAANHILGVDFSITNGVVDIENGVVTRVFRLEKELAFTTWLGGTIVIKTTDIGKQAFKDNKLLI